MGEATGRLHLLLMAFAVFFAFVHSTPDRHHVRVPTDGVGGAAAFDAADHSRGEAPPESGYEAHESSAGLRPLPELLRPASERIPARLMSEPRCGRLVGFGETPPPRAV